MRVKKPVLLVALVMLGGCERSFSDQDISKMEDEIKTQAQSQGFTVQQVSMLQDGPRKATGFAHISKMIGGYGPVNVQWTCEATMASDSNKYIWRCAP